MFTEQDLEALDLDDLLTLQRLITKEISKKVLTLRSLTEEDSDNDWEDTFNNIHDDDRTLDDVIISVRSYTCLRAMGITTLQQAYNLAPERLRNIRNLSKKGFLEIVKILEDNGFDYEGRWHINAETYKRTGNRYK